MYIKHNEKRVDALLKYKESTKSNIAHNISIIITIMILYYYFNNGTLAWALLIVDVLARIGGAITLHTINNAIEKELGID